MQPHELIVALNGLTADGLHTVLTGINAQRLIDNLPTTVTRDAIAKKISSAELWCVLGDRDDFSSKWLLERLRDRGGHPGAVAEAVLLTVGKDDDYNQGRGAGNMHTVNRDPYFPFGLVSYAQMLHIKAERFISLARKGGKSQFEGALDTALDLINYAGFAADFLKREAAKEK